MPQEFHVLQCFSCECFQVHIVKKVRKWNCKMCGEKQSIKKIYGSGSGKDCRVFVQSLNEKRLTQLQVATEMSTQLNEETRWDECGQNGVMDEIAILENSIHDKNNKGVKRSKWDEFTSRNGCEDFLSVVQNDKNENELVLKNSINKGVKRSKWDKFMLNQGEGEGKDVTDKTIVIDNIFEDKDTDLDAVFHL